MGIIVQVMPPFGIISVVILTIMTGIIAGIMFIIGCIIPGIMFIIADIGFIGIWVAVFMSCCPFTIAMETFHQLPPMGRGAAFLMTELCTRSMAPASDGTTADAFCSN